MVKRGWQGDPSCRFCENIETIQHLFFECSLARVVWSIVAIPLKANNIPTSLKTILELVQGMDSHQSPNACFCANSNLLGHLEGQK